MKKFFAALICCLTLFGASTVLAAVDGNKIAIGKIYPGMSESALIDAFGQPKTKNGDDWTYATFKVEVEHGVVEEVSTRSENITTPDGVRVGLAAEILNTTFGTADELDYDSDGFKYEYFSTDRTKKIEFKISGGVIVKITCKLVD